MLVNGAEQTIESAKFVQIDLCDVGVHQGDQLCFINTETGDDGCDVLAFGLPFVVGQIVTQAALRVDLHISALDFVQKDFGDP